MLSAQTPTTPEGSVCVSSATMNLAESSINPTDDSYVENPVTTGLTNPDTVQEKQNGQSVPETSCSMDSAFTTTPVQLHSTGNIRETEKYKEQSDSKQGLQTEKLTTSEIVTDKFECSFTESDDSDSDGEHSKMKKKDDGFFQITFDMDDDSILSTENSECGTFLTCCVCGKELPETTVAEAGKEMCNTCRLVRFMPEETKARGKRGRKKTLASSESKVAVKPTINKCPRKSTVKVENNDSIAPVRKSTRKRVSTIVIDQTAGDSEEDISLSEDMTADDYVGEDNYTEVKHMKPREKKCVVQEEISKSKYAQELNLTPTVKSETDGTTEPEIPPEVMSLIIRGNMPPRKKGRPKGSKNKPKALRAAEKVAKRDMKFNKRWYRGRGPVPDANPDSADGLWACEFCGKAFPIRRNFLAHRRKHSGRHKCDECGDTFECNSKLQRHIRRHRGEKPFACHLCPKAYSENMWLQRHLATHLSEGHAPQPKPYQCNICGRQYTHKGTMIYHVKTHTETKFYQCDVCGKQFTHRSSLECHIKTHTGEKPYVCEVCGKRFADRSVQLRHTRSHSGDKPYKCSVCDKGFTQSGTLNIHMRLHTSEKPYKCKICGTGFLKRCDLSKHSKCHVGEMLTKKANLITCRVNEGRGADIQEKAAQILINAYGEKRPDGTIEIKTRRLEQPVETEHYEQEDTAEHVQAGQVVDMIQTVGITSGDTHHLDQRAMSSHHEVSEQDQIQQHSEDIQRRALEFLAMRRQEIEQQQGLQILHPPLHRSTIDLGSLDRPVMDHHSMEIVTEQQTSDRQRLEQQIERHVDQHPVERQLLEQVEGQVIGQPQMIENQQTEQQRLEQMSPPQQQQQQQQQEPVWICKYN
ncbi:zinc finger and BTB domain-containing protein 24-like isoform X2 [Haliotis rubra]|nr:zinc finger and BTB domain-containing protein 24-like isoform X2 [Haliotis rubra]